MQEFRGTSTEGKAARDQSMGGITEYGRREILPPQINVLTSITLILRMALAEEPKRIAHDASNTHTGRRSYQLIVSAIAAWSRGRILKSPEHGPKHVGTYIDAPTCFLRPRVPHSQSLSMPLALREMKDEGPPTANATLP